MTARLFIGDVFDRMAELPDASFDMILTSPPFLALRSYLPDDHPDKHKEIGSEATPAEFLDTLLELTTVWRRLLAPHGSLVVELGDTYAGSGGAGGDYGPDGMRGDQSKFKGSALADRKNKVLRADGNRLQQGPGWPMDKSLSMLPTLYPACLAYGRNLLRRPLTARELLAHAEELADVFPDLSVRDLLEQLGLFLARHEELGRGLGIEIEPWRIRNLKPWIRTNPPVGALGDKERPATSYITVATLSRDRWFDLDAVRTTPVTNLPNARGNNTKGSDVNSHRFAERVNDNGGAPPLDWVHTVDLILDTELDTRASKTSRGSTRSFNGGAHRYPGHGTQDEHDGGSETTGARGHHLRRALERAGILTTLDALDISPKGYAGAHYAVWPPQLCQRLIDEMCPRRVCTQCGEPSRRIVGEATYVNNAGRPASLDMDRSRHHKPDELVRHFETTGDNSAHRIAPTVGWSDCGHNNWRPGHVLDPFSGSSTTLAVATGMGRNATGIDLDPRNADLARERCGMFLEVDERPTDEVAS